MSARRNARLLRKTIEHETSRDDKKKTCQASTRDCGRHVPVCPLHKLRLQKSGKLAEARNPESQKTLRAGCPRSVTRGGESQRQPWNLILCECRRRLIAHSCPRDENGRSRPPARPPRRAVPARRSTTTVRAPSAEPVACQHCRIRRRFVSRAAVRVESTTSGSMAPRHGHHSRSSISAGRQVPGAETDKTKNGLRNPVRQ